MPASDKPEQAHQGDASDVEMAERGTPAPSPQQLLATRRAEEIAMEKRLQDLRPFIEMLESLMIECVESGAQDNMTAFIVDRWMERVPPHLDPGMPDDSDDDLESVENLTSTPHSTTTSVGPAGEQAIGSGLLQSSTPVPASASTKPAMKKRLPLKQFVLRYLSHDEAREVDRITMSGTRETAQSQSCSVCHASTKTGLHYGQRTCEGCKGFFTRTVQGRHVLQCRGVVKDSCPVTEEARNSCGRCRFKQCLLVGMAPAAVRNDHAPGGRNDGAVYHKSLLASSGDEEEKIAQ